MKYNSLKSASLFVAVISATLFGCLKDDAFDNKEIQSVAGDGHQNVVGIGLTATTISNHLQLAFDKSDVDTTLDAVPVTLAGLPATEDIQVTLSINPALLGDYNAENGTLHEEAPTSVYTVTNSGDSATGYIVTIPKGSNTGYLQIVIKPNSFLGVDYALGLQITNVSSGYLISSNLGSGILAMSTKNLWDGKYTLTQKTVGWAAYGIADGDTYTWPSDVSLITASAVADDIHTAETGAGQPAFTSTGGLTSFGATATRFVFDPTTNAVVDVINLAPDDGRGRTFFLNPDVPDSRYDPDTKIIYVSFGMTQNGRPNQYFYDTLSYVGPR